MCVCVCVLLCPAHTIWISQPEEGVGGLGAERDALYCRRYLCTFLWNILRPPLRACRLFGKSNYIELGGPQAGDVASGLKKWCSYAHIVCSTKHVYTGPESINNLFVLDTNKMHCMYAFACVRWADSPQCLASSSIRQPTVLVSHWCKMGLIQVRPIVTLIGAYICNIFMST